MPGASNPVASTPGQGVSHSKSFRTRLGFGGSNGSSGVSNKPSFFTQLKAGRKSFGGPGEVRPFEQPVLVIDREPEQQGGLHDNRVVLNEETDPSQPPQSHVKYSTGSPTEDSYFSRQRQTASHSLPASPIDAHRTVMGSECSSANGAVLEAQLNPDESGASKHLPDLPADLSLLINEPPPETASQSDFHGSGVSASSQGKARAEAPVAGSSPAALENHDQTQRWNVQELLCIRSVASSPPGLRKDGPEAGQSAVSGFTSGAVENASTSFDLSSARLSLDLMRETIGEDWARSLLIEGSAIPSADTSGMLSAPNSSTLDGSRPVTSTPFCSPSTSLSPPLDGDPEVSFNLDALDPDLVALLRPKHHNHGPPRINHIVTPTPLEPFAPPPDPLNPGLSAKRPTSPPTSTRASSSSHSHRVWSQVEGLAPSPMRKYATLASTSQSRLPRSYTVQDMMSSSHSSKPSTSDTHLNLSRLQIHAQDIQHSPSPTAPSPSDTPSDLSKHPSPLSGPPLTLGDLERKVEPSPVPSSSASMSNDKVTMRRRAHTAASAQVQPPRPGSALTSSTDSRPALRYTPQERDRELRPASASPSPGELGQSVRAFGSMGRERERARPSIDGIFPARFSPEGSAGRPTSVGGRPLNGLHGGPGPNSLFPPLREREWQSPAEGRYRKRSMSLDQSSAAGSERRGEIPRRYVGGARERLGLADDRDRFTESVRYEGSDVGYGPRDGLGALYDGRDRDHDRERYAYGHAYGDRERVGRPHTDWLGPRTAKAFAAAGLLDDPREGSGSSTVKYGSFARSASERDFSTPSAGGARERRSPVSRGFSPADSEQERVLSRYNSVSNVRSSSERDFRPRAGTESTSTASMARPPSRGEAWSHTRVAPLFTRTMSDLISQRGSADGRDSVSAIHPRTGSAYSASGPGTTGGSAGSGGGRASPTTTSSLAAIQAQIQSLKDKHDSQTEALLAALADSQRTGRELREENESLKGQVRTLEERLVEAITNSRRREKELGRARRTRSPESPEPTRTMLSHRDPHLPPPLSKLPARSTAEPIKRRLSTSSSVFPLVPGSMSLLMGETPGSPLQGSLGSGSSPPPSPTLVLPRPASKQKLAEQQGINGQAESPLSAPQPISISHKRSTSGASMATSANFSFETGSPGSLKLKPEHELLLGDMTRLSLITGFGGDSEGEGL